MNFDVATFGTQALSWLQEKAPSVIGVLVALGITWVVAGTVKRGILRTCERADFDATLSRFFANLARYLLVVAAVLSCLGVFGVDTTSFAALIGAAGLAVGLAFQGTLSNFAAGVMLLIFRPFNVNDFVEAGGKKGVVQVIDLFSTELLTAQNVKIIVPNGAIFGSTIQNFTHGVHRRVDVEVGCDYSADIDETRATLEAAIRDLPSARETPAPSVVLKGLGGSSVDWVVRVHADTAKYWDLHQEVVRAVKYALDEKGIGIPFPQMDVHIDGSLGGDSQ